MTVAVLLRLLADALREGRLAGHAEVVETGETLRFKNLDEVVAFLQGTTGDHVATRLSGEPVPGESTEDGRSGR